MSRSEELFGTARLLELCTQISGTQTSGIQTLENSHAADAANPSVPTAPDLLLSGIDTSLSAFTDGAPQSDDITLLALSYK